MNETKTLIIGAGLAGLTLAYLLEKQGHDYLLLEARDRIGGRILTSRRNGGAPLELGATWLGKKHDVLTGLLNELGVGTFGQLTGGRAIYEASSLSPAQVVQLPHNDEPSYRIEGGSDRLIQALAERIPQQKLRLKEAVFHVQANVDGMLVLSSNNSFYANRVVSTLPPRLLVDRVAITPELPFSIRQIAANTHTWMGESIKVGLRYAEPFWRENGGPGGTIFSNVGPVSEMYDHTNVEDNQYALKGFLNGAYHSVSREERREMVLDQLRKYYGAIVDTYLAYEEGVWRHEPHTFVPYTDHVLPHQHNGHPVFREAYLDGRLLLAGSETAALYPGYMDGAVRSARRVADLIGKLEFRG